jgi:mannose-6-phosphate isomerase-like protein (cupin superfamily)
MSAGGVLRVDKPWGYELHYAVTDQYCGKVLVVRAGEELSLQYHEVKDETIYVQTGRIEAAIGPDTDRLETVVAGPGHTFRIPPGTVHRMRALEDTVLLEVSTPFLDDIVRLDDRYGRAGTS